MLDPRGLCCLALGIQEHILVDRSVAPELALRVIVRPPDHRKQTNAFREPGRSASNRTALVASLIGNAVCGEDIVPVVRLLMQ